MTTAAEARAGGAGPAAEPPRTWLRRIAGEHAEERVYRVLAFAFLPGGIVFGLLGAPAVVAQRAEWPAWWTVAAFVVGVGPSLLLGATAFLLPLRALRLVAGINAAGTLLVLASVPLVATGRHVGGPVWFEEVCGLGLISAALALPAAGAAAASALGGAVNLVDRLLVEGQGALVVAVQNGLYVFLFTLTFIALGVNGLTAARGADLEEAAAEAVTAEAVTDAARERERARINALVHDRVLATLLAAARRNPGSADLERRDAARALEGLHELLEDAPPADLSGERFAWKVQALTTDLVPEALFHYELDAETVVPGPVTTALLEAAEEAIRNSLRHAGDANRTVHVRIGSDGADVDVLDDGVGFDRAAIRPGSLGITESIEGRLRALPGGSARVISQQGVGTRVTLRWHG